jgi:hypothetical protein
VPHSLIVALVLAAAPARSHFEPNGAFPAPGAPTATGDPNANGGGIPGTSGGTVTTSAAAATSGGGGVGTSGTTGESSLPSDPSSGSRTTTSATAATSRGRGVGTTASTGGTSGGKNGNGGSKSGRSGESTNRSLIGGIVGGIAALVLLAIASLCWKRQSATSKSENAENLSPIDTSAAPSLIKRDETGKVVPLGDVEQPEDVPLAVTTAVAAGGGTADYILPAPTAWAALNGAAPSVDFCVPEPADQTTAVMPTSDTVDSTMLSSSYVTPPPAQNAVR